MEDLQTSETPIDPIKALNIMFEGGEDIPATAEVEEPGEDKSEVEEPPTEEPASDEGDGEDEVEAAPEKPQSKAQKRIQKLVAERKELEAKLEAATSAHQSSQLDQVRAEQRAALAEVQAENKRLAQALAAIQQHKADAEDTPVDKAFKEYMTKHIAPYVQGFEAEKQAFAEAKADAERRQRSLEFQQTALSATDAHVLKDIATEQKQGMTQKMASVVAAFSAAFKIPPEEAAKEARALFEEYHQARGEAKKAMVKQKVAASQKAAPVASTGHVTAKDGGAADYSVEQLMKAGYHGRDVVELLFNASRDGYKKVK